MPNGAKGLAVVAGATGYLGGNVVRALHGAGYRVRALARNPDRLGDLRELCHEVAKAEVTRPETLEGVFDGADLAFSSIGIRHFRRKPTIWDVDMQANLNLVEHAAKAKVPRFAFTSVFLGDEMRGKLPVAEARERVVDALKATEMTTIILRPTGFFNDMAEFLAMAKKGRVYVFGDGSAKVNPIHGADIAAAMIEAVEAGPSGHISLPLGGPDVFSGREIAELAFKAVGKPVKITRLPAGVLGGLATLTRPFNENLSTMLRMFALFSANGGVAPSTGTHHLSDFYAELAAK